MEAISIGLDSPIFIGFSHETGTPSGFGGYDGGDGGCDGGGSVGAD